MYLLDKISVKSRIIVLIVLFLFLFSLFAIVVLQKVDLQKNVSKKIYEHPLKVTNAALNARVGIVRIHRTMKDLSTSQSQLEITLAIQKVLEEEKFVYQQLDIVKERILGIEGKSLIGQSIKMFADWKPIRLEVEDLIFHGKMVEANAITRKKGADYVKRLEQKMAELTNYAQNKATEYTVNAEETHNQVIITLLIAFLLISVITSLIAYLIIQSIFTPLKTLNNKMTTITSGGEMSLVPLVGNNEFTLVASNFNGLITMLKNQLWLKECLNQLNDNLSDDLTQHQVGDLALNFIARNTEACMATLYIKNEDSKLQLLSTFASEDVTVNPKTFELGEGVIGQVAMDEKSLLLTDIDCQDIVVTSSTINQAPRSVYIVPILFEKKLLAVMELSFFHRLPQEYSQLIDQASITIASFLNIAIQRTLINQLFGEANEKNEILEEKSKEIVATNQELEAQTNELQIQAMELKQNQRKIEEGDRLKSEFLSNMSHELRTPLNSIMSLSQLMLSRGLGKDLTKSEEYLQVIDRNSRQLLNLINDILDLSKIESGKMDVVFSQFEPQQLVERLQETINPLLQNKPVELILSIQNSSPITSDLKKVYQILLNFLANSVKFTNTGSITINVQETTDHHVFKVSDTGIGMSLEQQAHIFDEFRQVDGSYTRKYEGTGLGLTISKKLALLLKAEIIVDSELDKGSSFTLLLPKKMKNEQLSKYSDFTIHSNHQSNQRNQLSLEEETKISDKKPKILLVEDNEIAILQIVDLLQANGFESAVARDGIEGVKIVDEYKPDAIVLDLMMPKFDGFEVLEQIRSKQETATIPVLILTAKELTKAEFSRLSANNIQQLVQKGTTDREQLIECVRNLVNQPVIPSESTGKTTEIHSQPSTKLKVLLVEDNLDNQTTISAILEELDIELLMAEDGKKGVEIAIREVPALILMDIQMPVMNGIDAIKELKTIPACQSIPIIAITARVMSSDVSFIDESGADDYLSKPIVGVELIKKVNKWLAVSQDKNGESKEDV